MLRRTLATVVWCSVLTGCVYVPGPPPPTPYPASYIPTVVYLTALAIDAAAQTATLPTMAPTVTRTFLPPTAASTLSPTPGPRVPLAAIQVTAPGPMSRIVSPLRVQALAIAADTRQIELDLFGEDGRLLGRSLVAVPGSELGDSLSVKIPFEIRAAGETGFVQVSTRDFRGRLQALVTVSVLLLSAGESQINPAGNTVYERVALADLPPKTDISGGMLQISGEILPYNRSPVIMELVSNEGAALSLRVLNVSGADWQSVETTLPYRVDKATPARLYVRQADELLGGDGYVYSLPLNLMP